MKKNKKNILYAGTIIGLTFILLLLIYLFPNYAKQSQSNNPPFTISFIITFLIADLILIGIPAWVHSEYCRDYGKIKKVWFFVFSGAIAGILLGEAGNLIMLIPYTILMLVYAFFYKRFVWWKVALTSYLAGILIENVMNRSPLQSSTLIWISFFIYPYFLTKIWENRSKFLLISIIKDLKYPLTASAVLGSLSIYLYFLTAGRISPPLIFLAFALPIIIKILYQMLHKNSK